MVSSETCHSLRWADVEPSSHLDDIAPQRSATMDAIIYTQFVPLCVAATGCLLVDGIGLAKKWPAWHRIGLPIRSGQLTLPDGLPAGSELPAESRGPNAVWLGERTVGYWSSRVRIGFRDTIGFHAMRGMGIATSGTLEIAPDRRTATYTERLRPGPLGLFASLILAATLMLSHAGTTLPMLLLPFAFFSAFFSPFALWNAKHLRDVRGQLGVPP